MGARCAGFLYDPNDYATALEVTRRLVEDRALRERMGKAAREEAERWGWTPAIQRVRSQQYGRAIRIFSATRRCVFAVSASSTALLGLAPVAL